MIGGGSTRQSEHRIPPQRQAPLVVRNRMKTLTTLVLQFSILTVWSQTLPVSELFTTAVQSIRQTSQFIYIDSSLPYHRNISHYTVNGQLEGFIDDKQTKTTIILSKAELKELDKQIKSQKAIQWPIDLLTPSIRLAQDSIYSFTKYIRTPNFHQNKVYLWYYHFSQPVTTRNNTIAIFRVASMLNQSAGDDFLFVYEKQNDGWHRILTYWMGAW